MENKNKKGYKITGYENTHIYREFFSINQNSGCTKDFIRSNISGKEETGEYLCPNEIECSSETPNCDAHCIESEWENFTEWIITESEEKLIKKLDEMNIAYSADSSYYEIMKNGSTETLEANYVYDVELTEEEKNKLENEGYTISEN